MCSRKRYQLQCLFRFFIIFNTFFFRKIFTENVESVTDCNNSIENDIYDTLPLADSPFFTPGANSIYFHETSCHGRINSRKACAVESAARLHPYRQINLLFTSAVTYEMIENDPLVTLLEYRNVLLARILFDDYGKNTVLEPILSEYMNKSVFPSEHAADILRVLTLLKFGGAYFDTDVIIVRNLDFMPGNWVAKKSKDDVGTSAMAFKTDVTGRSATMAMLLQIYATFDPKLWSYNGPTVIQTVLDRVCPNVVLTGGICQGVHIFPSVFFYPLSSSEHNTYFKNGDIKLLVKPFMHHLWNNWTYNLKVEKDSPYAKLAKKYCPKIFETYGDKFGA